MYGIANQQGRVTYQISLGVIALRAEYKLADEPVQHVLQLARLVGSIHNEAGILWVHLRLSTKLTAKVLAGVYRVKEENKIIESSHSTHRCSTHKMEACLEPFLFQPCSQPLS